MAFETTFLDALATLLHTEGAGTYKPTGGYTAAEVGIYMDQLAATPDRGIAMALYPVDDNTGTTDATIGIQFRIRGRRGNRADVKNTRDAIYDVLDNRTHYDLGGTPVVRSWHQSGAALPPDDNDRQQSTANYYFQINRTSPHRRD